MIRTSRMTERIRRDRRPAPAWHRTGFRCLQGSTRVLIVVCSVLLASLAALVSTSPAARADTKTGPSTTGTASTVSPSTVAVGGTIMYTLSGFPSGVTVLSRNWTDLEAEADRSRRGVRPISARRGGWPCGRMCS